MVAQDLAYKEEATKGSAGVIGFLREFNFGDPSMSARQAVDNLIKRLGGNAGEGFVDPQGILPDLGDALKAGGFTPVNNWEETKAALLKALADWESHDKAWQDGVSRLHEDWRV